jgi:hypothetical protein
MFAAETGRETDQELGGNECEPVARLNGCSEVPPDNASAERLGWAKSLGQN